MAKNRWEPAAFHQWYEKLPMEKRERVWIDLKSEHRKLYVEWKTFRGFVTASGLDVDPRSIHMCDPNAARPALPESGRRTPDIRKCGVQC